MKEALKTVVLLGLILSALALTWLTWFYEMELSLPFGAVESFPPAEEGRTELKAAAWPVEACVMSDGIRYGLRQDIAGIGQLYNAIPLGLALGRAQNPKPLSRAEWEAALVQDGVFFRFSGCVPVGALAAWLSVDASAELTGHILRFAVTRDGDNALLLIQTEDLEFTRYDTATAYMVFSDAAAEYRADWERCTFAFELESPISGLEPETMLFDGTPTVQTALIQPVSDQSGLLDAIRRALRIPRTATSYPETDDATVYVDNLRTLLVSKEGDFLYRNPEVDTGGALDENGCIEAARALVSAAEPFLGAARLPMDCAYWTENIFTVRFSYELHGLPVELAPLCEMRFQNGILTEARLVLRSLSLDDGFARLLPERQAAALANAPRRRFGLVYFDMGQGVLRPDWAVR